MSEMQFDTLLYFAVVLGGWYVFYTKVWIPIWARLLYEIMNPTRLTQQPRGDDLAVMVGTGDPAGDLHAYFRVQWDIRKHSIRVQDLVMRKLLVTTGLWDHKGIVVVRHGLYSDYVLVPVTHIDPYTHPKRYYGSFVDVVIDFIIRVVPNSFSRRIKTVH